MLEKTPFAPRNGLRIVEEDEFRGRVQRARKSAGGGNSGALGKRLGKALAGKTVGKRASTPSRPFAIDARQRVVAKVSFHNHGARAGGGGGGGKLMAHAAYLQRDGAEREGERGRFYDEAQDLALDTSERLQEWSVEDKRHFRVMLAPESGALLVRESGDLKEFTRETMARMERDLGVKLDWVAIDHHNTDNPHAHVIVRGVRRDGADLLLPREYVSHGLREAARDVATDLIGARGRADERLRLEREVQSRGLSRLDHVIEHELGGRSEILLQRLGRGRDPAFADALKARARELARIGLARETRRNVLKFERDWIERLAAARPLDVRRQLAQARLYEKSLGRVAGEVRELGPRGDTPDRALLVVETPDKGRLVMNTSMDAIADLQRGSLVALNPAGRRGEVERLAFHPASEQINARADTALDREIDRIARGETRLLPPTPGVEAALTERARVLEAQGLGVRSASGKFYFREGAREGLQRAELEHAVLEAGRTHNGVFRDLAHEKGRDGGLDGSLGDDNPWKVRETKELFAGKTAILERGRDIALAPIKPGMGIGAGDNVALKLMNDPARAPQLDMMKLLGRGLGLER
jgi:hypothetical protein